MKMKKINGGAGIGKPACKLHAASLNVLHSEGNLKTRNWVKNFYPICCQRDLMKMLLAAHDQKK